MGRPRRRRFNQVQKANKGEETEVKGREGKRDQHLRSSVRTNLKNGKRRQTLTDTFERRLTCIIQISDKQKRAQSVGGERLSPLENVTFPRVISLWEGTLDSKFEGLLQYVSAISKS